MKASLTFLLVFITVFVFSQTSDNEDLNILVDQMPANDNSDYVKENNSGTYIDERNGNIYELIKVGKQVWMSQNINFEIPDSWCYDDKKSNCEKYGRLYTYEAAKHVCPDGWHLPSDAEWQTIIVQLEKEREGRTLTQEEKKNGFNTDLAGWGSNSGNYYNKKEIGFYWTSTVKTGNFAWYIYINSLSNDFSKNYHNINKAFSVRCVKD